MGIRIALQVQFLASVIVGAGQPAVKDQIGHAIGPERLRWRICLTFFIVLSRPVWRLYPMSWVRRLFPPDMAGKVQRYGIVIPHTILYLGIHSAEEDSSVRWHGDTDSHPQTRTQIPALLSSVALQGGFSN